MNDIRMNNAYSTDGRLQVAGAGGAAGHWQAEKAEESAAAAVASAAVASAAVASSSLPAAAPGRSAVPLPAQRRSGRAREDAVSLRLVQVYLTPVIDEFLRQARSTAIMQGLDVSASAVVRHALERLMGTVSPAEIVELLGSSRGQSQRRRGRPRRLMPSAYVNLYMHNP
jgi:hypothetical protein